MPGFDGATGWLNSPPLTAEDLRAKVVLVDFWTYTCINWLRTLAYVRAWAEKYRGSGLLVVGVHTPEFPFERDIDNVRRAANDLNVGYPIALDSNYEVWQAFSNRYWPAVYIADVEGRIRHHQFGEGGYDDCERGIQQLLREAGAEAVPDDLVSVTPTGFEAQADWTNLRSPETYLGYAQSQSFASRGGPDTGRVATYELPDMLMLNQWALAGDWTIERGVSVLNGRDGRIAFRFHARDVNLVMRSPKRLHRSGCSSTERRPATPAESTWTNKGMERSPSRASTSWFASRGPITDRTIEIGFAAPDVETYVFTFG